MIDFRLSLAFALLFAFSAAQAQTMFVTDELVITLRTGPSTQNSIIANLSTGDAVELLEQDPETGYSRVRVIDDAEEGWVLTRYLMDEPTADLALATATGELGSAQSRIDTLEAELADTRAALAEAQSALEAAETSHRSVSAELDDIRTASASVIEMRDQNESLRQRNLELSTELDALMLEAGRLGSRSRQNWFVVGSLVLAFGIVIGLVAPSLRPRRRSNW